MKKLIVVSTDIYLTKNSEETKADTVKEKGVENALWDR